MENKKDFLAQEHYMKIIKLQNKVDTKFKKKIMRKSKFYGKRKINQIEISLL
jgi:hypothetical protein